MRLFLPLIQGLCAFFLTPLLRHTLSSRFALHGLRALELYVSLFFFRYRKVPLFPPKCSLSQPMGWGGRGYRSSSCPLEGIAPCGGIAIQRRKKHTRPPPKINLSGKFLASKRNFPGRWWIQKPYKNPAKPDLPPKSFLCGPHFLGKDKFLARAGRCLLSFSQLSQSPIAVLWGTKGRGRRTKRASQQHVLDDHF